jgi:hypothetical protein
MGGTRRINFCVGGKHVFLWDGLFLQLVHPLIPNGLL